MSSWVNFGPPRVVVKSTFGAVFFVVLASIILPAPVLSNDGTLTGEIKLKAAFIVGFLRYVSFDSSKRAAVHVCVLGKDELSEHLPIIETQSVKGDIRLKVRFLSDTSELDTCQALYIAASEKERVSSIISEASKLRLLTIAEMPSFVDKGGVINIKRLGNRFSFEINMPAANNAGFDVSSKMLRIAVRIIE